MLACEYSWAPVFNTVKYVHTDGEGKGPKADIVLEISKEGCVNLRTRGDGSKIPKFLQTYLMDALFVP